MRVRGRVNENNCPEGRFTNDLHNFMGVLAYGIPGKYITLLEGGGGQVDRGAYDQLRSRRPRQEVGQQARHQADRQVRNLPLPVHCL